MGKLIDLRGKTFNNLTVIDRALNKGRVVWRCLCVCGRERNAFSYDLPSGRIKHCGCLKKKNKVGNKDKFYRTWSNMKSRCLNKNHPRYKNWGGRGVKVCERWLEFNNFYDDMYQSYLEHNEKYGGRQTTLERIDNNGNYESSNCRWATMREQILNTTKIEEKKEREKARYLSGLTKEKINNERKERNKKRRQIFLSKVGVDKNMTTEQNIRYMRMLGLTYKEISAFFCVSRQRIHQIIKKT